MPEAVIVSATRSPIGRANKGSLKDMRPDDLSAAMIQAALDKIPELDPKDIDDLYLGCGLPGGEMGFNMGRIVAVLMGYDHLPGATITRYCSSSEGVTGPFPQRATLNVLAEGEQPAACAPGIPARAAATAATATSARRDPMQLLFDRRLLLHYTRKAPKRGPYGKSG